MDADEREEEIAHQQELIKGYRKRQRVLEQQAAVFGLHVPPHIQIEIDDLNETIQQCKNKLSDCKSNLIDPLRQKLNIYTNIFSAIKDETSITYWDVLFVLSPMYNDKKINEETINLTMDAFRRFEHKLDWPKNKMPDYDAKSLIAFISEEIRLLKQQIAEIRNL
jgi:hypothetical protein